MAKCVERSKNKLIGLQFHGRQFTISHGGVRTQARLWFVTQHVFHDTGQPELNWRTIPRWTMNSVNVIRSDTLPLWLEDRLPFCCVTFGDREHPLVREVVTAHITPIHKSLSHGYYYALTAWYLWQPRLYILIDLKSVFLQTMLNPCDVIKLTSCFICFLFFSFSKFPVTYVFHLC